MYGRLAHTPWHARHALHVNAARESRALHRLTASACDWAPASGSTWLAHLVPQKVALAHAQHGSDVHVEVAAQWAQHIP